MKTNHTPGPWEAIESKSTIAIFGPLDRGCRYEVCRIFQKYHPDSIAYHDARLIAAAPDLLESLKAMFTFSDLIKDQRPASAYTLERAKAAIAKATGQ